MRIFYCTYYDHIMNARYNPVLAIENWNHCTDRLVTCSPDEEYTLHTLLGSDANICNIGVSIDVPSDIPVALNKTIDTAFIMGADVVVMIYGDIYLTPLGDDFLSVNIASVDEPFATLPSIGVDLYVEMSNHRATLTVSSKNKRAKSNELADGEEMVSVGDPWSDDPTMLLDIGYLSTDMYYAHLRNHASIWGMDPFKAQFMKLYERGNMREAIRHAYKEIRNWARKPLVATNMTPYKDIMDRLHLWEDYNMCMSVLKEFA